jgi:glycosyltransferase involved in cell wall biosynthesis
MREHQDFKSNVGISVIIPVLNEEGNIPILYSRLTDVLKTVGRTYEIFFVDDGSTDSSFEILQSLREKDARLKIIRFTRNFGQDIARTAALDHCKGQMIVLMDADLQDMPEEMPKLLAKIEEGYDVVYGMRKERQDNLFRTLSSKIYFRIIAKITRQVVNPQITSFRVLTRRAVDYMNEFRESPRFYGGLITWLGFPSTTIDIKHSRRYSGKTKYSLWALLRNAAEGVISFSDVPLRLIEYFGLTISAISFVIGIVMLIMWSIGQISVSGYTSIIVSLFFIGGILMIILGVIGEYIGRIHIEVKKRPLYVIRDILE